MIRNQTVFVLGAGASVPFRYPTGAELRTFIVDQLSGTSIVAGTVASCGIELATLPVFAREFERSGFQSIDRFLAARPDTAHIGKLAIAAAIRYCQNEIQLYQANGRRGTSDWYGHVWNLMSAGIDRAEDIAAANAVSFITFNYDVSLERFLFNAIRSAYGVENARALEIAKSITVHHVYGAMAPTEQDRYLSHDPWPSINAPVLKACAEKIRVMPHQRPERDERCVELLSRAHNTIFLGFGFDEMNCLRLGVADVMEGLDMSRQPFGTALGFTDEEIGVAQLRIASRSPRQQLWDLDCLQLLRKLAARLV